MKAGCGRMSTSPWRARRLIGFLVIALMVVNVFTTRRVMAAVSNYDPASQATVGKVLPNDWHISPAGVQVTVGNLPTNGAVTPDGHYLAVTNNGCSKDTQEISIIDLK